MKKIRFLAKLLPFIFCFLLSGALTAGTPLFTLTPLSATSLQVPSTSIATVQYLVENQSNKAHTLVVVPRFGITQVTSAGNCPSPFTLSGKQSCILILQINGTQLYGAINGGPTVCQQGPDGNPSPFLCYRPAATNLLNITIIPTASVFYTGAENGKVYYSFNSGSTWAATAQMPAGGSPINSVFATTATLYVGADNGFIYYSNNNGNNWKRTSSPDQSAVNTVFATANRLYAGTANGFVYYSTNNGSSWQSTATPPDPGNAVNSLFVTANNVLYAGTESGSVFYSITNGSAWASINGQPDGSAIKDIFVTNSEIYVNTMNEYAYESMALTGGGSWTAFAQTIYSLFVNGLGTAIYAGTQGGYVYSLTNGNELGFVDYSLMNSVYVLQ